MEPKIRTPVSRQDPREERGAKLAYFDDVTELDNGIRCEMLRIPSANPTGFFQAISAPGSMPKAEILAKLFLPTGQGVWPVVIVVPGSLGVGPPHVAAARLLTDRGLAACVVDPFGERGVVSTVANQTQYSFAASAWDVLATVRVLSSRKEIDATRIGAQGHSRGGSAVLSAACMAHLVDVGSPTLRGVYAAYPWSGLQFLQAQCRDDGCAIRDRRPGRVVFAAAGPGAHARDTALRRQRELPDIQGTRTTALIGTRPWS